MISKRTMFFMIGALCLLFVPFFAMQFNVGGWDWQLNDFVIMGVLLTGFGIALAAATNKDTPLVRRIIGLSVIGFILLLYMHLAVGIVDTWPLAGS
jgi:peptidoglycan/LPS O-acetylase OafA/YrhL